MSTQGKIFDALVVLRPGSSFSVEEDKSIVWNDPNTTQPTTSKINAEIARQETENLHIEPRRISYPSIQDQLDMMWHDKQNDTTTWEDAIAKVKSDNPKGGS